jgi:hypothetical protein
VLFAAVRTQHLAEVGVRVGRFQLPQRPAEPGPHLLEMNHIRADRAVRQPCSGPGEHEPGQHIGLELRQLLRARRRSSLPKIAHRGQGHPRPPVQLNPNNIVVSENDSARLTFSQVADGHPNEGNQPGPAAARQSDHTGTPGIFHIIDITTL